LTSADPAVPALRVASDDDSWEVIGLIAACWSEYPGCVMDAHGECPDLLAPATAYRTMGGAFWVATDGCGAVIATVGWRPVAAGGLELERLYVNQRFRRRGLAADLTELVERAAGEHRAPTIELWSDSRFVAAHRFYVGRGYRRTGEERDLGDLSHTHEYHYLKRLVPASTIDSTPPVTP
jgi:GNAT superfamily N-acetyltransferase